MRTSHDIQLVLSPIFNPSPEAVVNKVKIYKFSYQGMHTLGLRCWIV